MFGESALEIFSRDRVNGDDRVKRGRVKYQRSRSCRFAVSNTGEKKGSSS
jgi:hypothetical protein